MTFNEGARLDPSRIQRRGRGAGSGGMAVGGGIGAIVLVILGMIFGVDLSSLGIGSAPGSNIEAADPELQKELEEACTDGEAANARVDCRMVGTLNSLDAYWESATPTSGSDFTYPEFALFDSVTDTACGTASTQTGPFYCPGDSTIYLDVTFFDVLVQQLGSSEGPLAQMFVLAHEYGHHIQHIIGVFDVADRSDSGATSDSVYVELMADCLAGVWANHASTVPDDGGEPFLQPLTSQDIEDALQAAASVGDDHIQEATQGQADPDSFTHGTSEQRQQWFQKGYDSGSPYVCDYFGVTKRTDNN